MDELKLGRYEIVEELGRGAMGTVWLAQDPVLGRLVALKTFSPRTSQGLTATACFLREARAAGSLDHPNIVRIHDVQDGEETGSPFLAMEYVAGNDLGELLRPGLPLPADFVLKVVTQVAEALDYAHRHRVIHRDVKPGNILITPDETVKLTDFGLASTAAGAGPLRYGTPQYVAPEQLLGKTVDRRADVFALAAVAHEALTGVRPFDGADAREIVRRVAHDPPALPAEPGARLPRAVEAVLLRGLDKDPARRFATAGELVGALETALLRDNGAATQDLSDLLPELPLEPPAAAPVVALARVGRPRRRRPWRWAAALLLALAAAATAWGLVGDRDAAGNPPAPGPVSPPHRVSLPHRAALADARRLLAAGDPVAAGRFAELARQMAPHRAEVRELYDAVTAELDTLRLDDARSEEIATLRRLGDRAVRSARWSEARAVAGRLKQIDSALPELAELRQRIAAGETLERQRLETERAAEARIVPARAAAISLPATADEPEPNWSDLRIDFFSQLPRGVFTVYAGQEQIASQTFRFGKKGGLFRKADGAGRLEAKRRLGTGEIPLRVYLTLPGVPATSRSVLATFHGGTERVLRILVDADGELTIRLD